MTDSASAFLDLRNLRAIGKQTRGMLSRIGGQSIKKRNGGSFLTIKKD